VSSDPLLGERITELSAVFAVVKAVYDGVKWCIDNTKRIARLVKTVFQGLPDLASGFSVWRYSIIWRNRLEADLQAGHETIPGFQHPQPGLHAPGGQENRIG
jgi:hypothetical protein